MFFVLSAQFGAVQIIGVAYMRYIKSLSFLLCIIILLTMLIGCVPKSPVNIPETDNSQLNEVDDTSDTTEIQLNDKDTLTDYYFNGKDFNISVRETTSYEYTVDESAQMTSVQREVFTRNQTIQDRFGVKLNYTMSNCANAFRTEFTANLANTMSGLAPHQLLSGHMTVISPQQYYGYLLDLCSLPEFDITKEWWSEEIYEECNYNGRLYFASGDIAYTMYEYLEVMFVNESAFERNKVDFDGKVSELYDLVREGEWTLEMLILYTTNYAIGLTDVDESEREYGLITNIHSLRSFLAATEASFEQRDGNGSVILPENPDTRLSTVTSRIKENLINKDNILAPSSNDDLRSIQTPVFASGRALFYGEQLGQAQYFDMSDDYGIVPLPLYDEIQETYHTTICNEVSSIAVPSNVSVDEHTMIGVIIEAMCMYGYQMITPEYFGNVLSQRLLGDEDCQDMLKLVRETFTIDHTLANTFGYGANHPYAVWKNALYGEKDLATCWAEKYKSLNGKLTTMKNSIEELQNN